MATSWETLIQAKKENVALQLEAAYRERLQEVYSQVSKNRHFSFLINPLDRIKIDDQI